MKIDTPDRSETLKKHLYILFIILLPIFASAQNIKVVIHVDDSYKPYSYAKDQKPMGMYIDVLKTAFSRMEGFDVTMKPIPWKRGKKLMEQGKGFGLAPAFFHGHDWPYLYPYSLPFYTEKIIAVLTERNGNTPRNDWPDDFIGLRVGNVAGFDGWGGDKFHALVKERKILYHEVGGSEQIIRMLAAERLDCIMMEEGAFDHQLKRMKKSGLYDEKKHAKLIKGPTIGTDPVYIGYSEPAIKKGNYPYAYKFQKAFDVTLYRMIKNGEIPRIMKNFRE